MEESNLWVITTQVRQQDSTYAQSGRDAYGVVRPPLRSSPNRVTTMFVVFSQNKYSPHLSPYFFLKNVPLPATFLFFVFSIQLAVLT